MKLPDSMKPKKRIVREILWQNMPLEITITKYMDNSIRMSSLKFLNQSDSDRFNKEAFAILSDAKSNKLFDDIEFEFALED